MTEQTALDTQNVLGNQSRTAVIDNGSFGTREVVFSTGRLAVVADSSIVSPMLTTTEPAACLASRPVSKVMLRVP